jgi:hypothetical protein
MCLWVALTAVSVLLTIRRIILGGGGGSEKFVHTNNLSENTPPPVPHLCASNEANHSRWVYEGKKKKETEKSMKPITYSVLILGLGALLFYRVSDPPSVAVYSAEWCPKH